MIGEGMERYRDHGLLVLRVGFGAGFIWYHGWPKLAGGPERWAGTGAAMENFGITFAPVFWGLLASLAESLGGLCLMLGLFFRPTVVAMAFVMLSATVNHHVTGQGTPAHSFKNLWVFLGLLAVGPGRFSLDHWIVTRRRDRRGETREAERETAPGASGGR